MNSETLHSSSVIETQRDFLPEDIFRAYDIRGNSETALTPPVMYRIGQALGSMIRDRSGTEIYVGRDGRLSSPPLHLALIQGILTTGTDVIDLGMISTPLLYYACMSQGQGHGAIVTGSHCAPSINGLKMVVDRMALHGPAIQSLLATLRGHHLHQGYGRYRTQLISHEYLRDYASAIGPLKPWSVVVDTANGVAGLWAPECLRRLGLEVKELFSEVDGTFPNHPPDPSVPEHLAALQAEVLRSGAHLGLAFDGDGDRVALLDERGEIIPADRMMMFLSECVLARHPGAPIIFDVKCSRHLETVIRGAGGVPVMWKTGHSLIKEKMLELASPLAGEMSGHIFVADGWHPFDDACYAAAYLLRALQHKVSAPSPSVHDIFSRYPQTYATPERLHAMPSDQAKFEAIERLKNKVRDLGLSFCAIDGVRLEYPDGWALVRASNTGPYLSMRFEAETEARLETIQAQTLVLLESCLT